MPKKSALKSLNKPYVKPVITQEVKPEIEDDENMRTSLVRFMKQYMGPDSILRFLSTEQLIKLFGYTPKQRQTVTQARKVANVPSTNALIDQAVAAYYRRISDKSRLSPVDYQHMTRGFGYTSTEKGNQRAVLVEILKRTGIDISQSDISKAQTAWENAVRTLLAHILFQHEPIKLELYADAELKLQRYDKEEGFIPWHEAYLGASVDSIDEHIAFANEHGLPWKENPLYITTSIKKMERTRDLITTYYNDPRLAVFCFCDLESAMRPRAGWRNLRTYIRKTQDVTRYTAQMHMSANRVASKLKYYGRMFGGRMPHIDISKCTEDSKRETEKLFLLLKSIGINEDNDILALVLLDKVFDIELLRHIYTETVADLKQPESLQDVLAAIH